MDLSKFKTHDWLVVGGGLGMLIFGSFFDWWSFDANGFFEASGGNAFDFFFTGTIPWLLLVASAVVVVLLVLDVLKRDQLPWPMLITAATVLAAFLLLLRLVFNFGAPDGISRGVGLYLSVLSGFVAAAGGVMGYTASGGDLKDFTDVDKLKGAFGATAGGSAGGEATTTPPPPPPTEPGAADRDDPLPPPQS